MKKFIALLLVGVLTTAVSIGATLAYLQDTDEDVNVMTVGKVKIDQLEYERVDTETKDEDATVQEFHDNKPLYPGVYENGFDFDVDDNYVDWEQIGKDEYTSGIWNPDEINNEVDKMVFVKNKGNYDAYVRTVFAFEAGNYADVDTFLSKVHLNLNDTDWEWEWLDEPVTIGESTYFVATATYKYALEPGAITGISLSQIALDKSATNADVEAFGDTYQVLVKSQAIQANGFDTAAAALNEGFGKITARHIPWDGDSPIQGTDVFTALNYLKGGSEQITKKVSNIVFGLAEDYSEIAMQNQGTLVDVEQDVPAYAYYVPNGSNYDVYLLASDTIYAPTDCSNLCNGMSNLVSFNTENLDFSRTTSMYRMLRDCNKLSEMDVSDWDTSNVTNMRDLFRGCKSMLSLDVSEWETGKVETMLALFQDCVLVTELNLNGWDVSKVQDATQMFNRCYALENLKIDQWNPVSLSVGTTMFQDCQSLKELDLSGWNTSSLQMANGMFNHCYSLAALDVFNWDVSKLTNAGVMFQACRELTSLDLSRWNMQSATDVGFMFYGCSKLKELDVTGWDVSNIQNFNGIFTKCYDLEEIKGIGAWVTSSGTKFQSVFDECSSLKSLDLSGFDTRNATIAEGMIEQTPSLETLILGENVSFTAPGFSIPAPQVEGNDGKWYNLETGVGYLPEEIPEGAATYVAVLPTNP